MVDDAITQRRFYVYVLFRPDGRPCYVGKGCGSRWDAHERRGSHNAHLQRIIVKAGGSLPKVKIREQLTELEAVETEIALVTAIGREKDGGPLVNLTIGGNGMSGYSFSEESKKKIREKLKGRIFSDVTLSRMKLAQLGKPRTTEHRASISAAQKGKKPTAKHKAATKAGIDAMTPEARAARSAAISAALTGKKLSLSHRQAISKAQRGIARGPYSESHRAAIGAAQKGKILSDEHRAKLRTAWVRRKQRNEMVRNEEMAL